MRSLRARLWRIGTAGMLLAALAASWGLGEAFSRATLANFDERLADDLLGLAGLIERGPEGTPVLSSEPDDRRYRRAFSGHYWLIDTGAAPLTSRSLWDAELAVPAPADGALRFVTLDGPLGQQLRAAVQPVRIPGTSAPAVVLVASDATDALARIAGFRLYAGLSAAGLVIVLLGIVAYQVAYGLRPLRALTGMLQALRTGAADRLAVEELPDEIRPLAVELNQLLDHQTRMVTRARNAASDLAHALKTPLSVVAAAAESRAPDLPEVVSAQVARMRRHIDHQLATAVVADARSRTPVAPAAAQVAALLRQLHADRGLELVVDVAADAVFQGERMDLEEMLGNLLDNACKWARRRIDLRGRVAAGRLRLVVADDGPGMAEDAMRAALRRGVRLDEQVPGSGLGLAIVQDLAASYGGMLALERAPAGGLAAILELPAVIVPERSHPPASGDEK